MDLFSLSNVVFSAILYKKRLDTRRSTTIAEMTDYWVSIRSSLQSQAEMVAEQILQRYPDGGAPEEWINELNYYKSLMEQVDRTTFKYANWVSGYAYEQIEYEHQLGISDAKDLIGMQNMLVLKGLAVPQIEILAGLTANVSPLGKLLWDIGGEEARMQISQALMNGLAQGMPMNGIANLMIDSFDLPLVRALVIARTEINRAYRTSTLLTYQTYGITKYKRMASQQRACMACLLLDGQVYESSSELEDHPNGACTMIPIVPGADEPEWEYGKDYFLTLSEEEQRNRMGNAYYEAWQRGDFDLSDLPRIEENVRWGGAPTITPLKELSPDWKSWYYGKGSQTPIPNINPTTQPPNNAFNSQPFLNKMNELLLMETRQDRREKLKSSLNFIKNGINSDERDALRYYTGNAYSRFNDPLRSNLRPDPDIVKEMSQIDNALRRAPSNTDEMVLFRRGWVKPGLQPGDLWIDKGYTSTTYYSDKYSDYDIEILVPAGSNNFALIEEISHFRTENEVLFNSGSIFQYIGLHSNGRTARFLYLGNTKDYEGLLP